MNGFWVEELCIMSEINRIQTAIYTGYLSLVCVQSRCRGKHPASIPPSFKDHLEALNNNKEIEVPFKIYIFTVHT